MLVDFTSTEFISTDFYIIIDTIRVVQSIAFVWNCRLSQGKVEFDTQLTHIRAVGIELIVASPWWVGWVDQAEGL